MTECAFCKEFLLSRGRNPILMKGLKVLANFRNVTSAFCHCRCAITAKWHLVTKLLGLPLVGLRDRAVIALLTYTFARVGAAVKMHVEDLYTQERRTWARLHEKGGKRHEMPCHHKLEAFLAEYIESAGIAGEPKGWLFRTTEGQSGCLTERPMSQADVYRMIRRRTADAGIKTKIGCHTFRAAGITEYLRNGGKLEIAQQMANHESARTTGLYDRRNDQVSLDEVERILI